MNSETHDRPGSDWLVGRFQSLRPYLLGVAYRMLGSVTESEDAVQEAWFRVGRGEVGQIEDLRAWLTTVVGRICLDMLRARRASRTTYVGSWLPEPVVNTNESDGPEEQAVLADSVGMALLVVLETLSPAERLAFVLHDVFAIPFDDIATVIDRSPDAARQLASRARRRVQAAPEPDQDFAQQREVIDAFLAAARAGDFEALLKVLDPDVVFRTDVGPVSAAAFGPVRGARAVASQVLASAPRYINGVRPTIVNGAPGNLFGSVKHPAAVISFTIVDGRIAEINLVADPAKLPGRRRHR